MLGFLPAFQAVVGADELVGGCVAQGGDERLAVEEWFGSGCTDACGWGNVPFARQGHG